MISSRKPLPRQAVLVLTTALSAILALITAGPAGAVTVPVPSGSDALTLTRDTTDYAARLARWDRWGSNSPKTLDDLPAAGRSGKTGLCYPTPFNPGVDADGYCWNNGDDDSGASGWAPQGISVPHSASGDGYWHSARWQVSSWHNGSEQSKLRFVRFDSGTPHYADVFPVTLSESGQPAPLVLHSDSVVWYEDNILIGSGRQLLVFRTSDLGMYTDAAGNPTYALPVVDAYRTTPGSACDVVEGNRPCLNSLSFDRANKALVSGEWVNWFKEDRPWKGREGDGRIIQWPFDLSTGRPAGGSVTTATQVWRSGVWGIQGVASQGGYLYLSGLCPSSFDTGYRESACVHRMGRNATDTAHVLTAVPDMAQNLDWDASQSRLVGINEVTQSGQTYPQRLVFTFLPTARTLTTVRLRNVSSGKCLLPYGASLNDGINVVQWDCNGTSSQNWYWNGSEIRNFQSDRCLTVYGGSTTKGANVVQWACNGDSSQQWNRVTGAAGGGSTLVNSRSALCLTLYGGSTSNNTNTVQWTCNATDPAHSWVGYTP